VIKLNYSHRLRQVLKLTGTVFVVTALVLLHLSYASDKTNDTATSHGEKDEKIHIIADKLVSDSETNSFEFIGDVKATQGDSVVTGDRLKVFYKKGTDTKDAGTKDSPLSSEQSIQKIIVKGHVVIKFDNRIAMAEQAIYTTETKILVLTGPDSKIISGNDVISGETITLYRADERIKVESGKEKRVEAVFYTGEQGIK